MFSIVTTVCERIYFSTALIIFLKTIVGNSVCLQLLEKLQLEYIVLIYKNQIWRGFYIYSFNIMFHILWNNRNAFISMFVAFLIDQSTWHRQKPVKLFLFMV